MIFATDSPKATIFQFSDLLCNLHSIKQGDRSLSQYFIALKILWDELEYLSTTPSCSCIVPCTCDLAKAGQSYKHMEYVSCFLKGLSDNYQNIRTQILLFNLIPNIRHVYSLIAQQEVTSLYPFTLTPIILYANNPNKTGNGRGRDHTKTTLIKLVMEDEEIIQKVRSYAPNYNKMNHTVETRYFIHGFPPGYHTKNKRSSSYSKPNINSEKDGVISKEYYQYLLLFLQ